MKPGLRAKHLLLIALLCLLLAACSGRPLLVLDPYIAGLTNEESLKAVDFEQVSGEYPWLDTYGVILRKNNADQVVVSPFLYDAARGLAADHAEKEFYVLGMRRPGINPALLPPNIDFIPISRMQAMKDLAGYLREYLDQSMLDGQAGQGPVVALFLFTGNEYRAEEARLLRSGVRDYPSSMITVRQYDALPSRSALDQEVARLQGGKQVLIVSLMSSRTPDLVQATRGHSFFVFGENLGMVQSAPHIVGSIEYDYGRVLQEIQAALGKKAPLNDFQASFVLY
ncbi:MAG: hypothetical protein D6B26_02870 [Spirochaetaceae bacterium]|nr:MAG: hypothetical protein D6B26_02870 [Spirochaetaceae bacterium]